MGIRQQRKHYIVFIGLYLVLNGYYLVEWIYKLLHSDKEVNIGSIPGISIFILFWIGFMVLLFKLGKDELKKLRKA